MVRSGASVLVLALVVSVLAVPSAADERLVEACAANVPPAGFPDVQGGVHERAIDCVAWWQIAHGDGQGRYHPAAGIRRDQITAMLARLLAGVGRPAAPAGDQGFADVAGNVHVGSINALAAMGVVRGVSADRFAPAHPVRRD